MKKSLITSLIFLTFLFAQSVSAAPASSKSIRTLMELTGAGDLGKQMMYQMLPALQQMAPNAPQAYWDAFMKEVDTDEMITLIIPVYQKQFSEKDIQELITFYKTPVGQKFIKAQPQILQESMAIGQQWGQALARKVLNDLQK